MHDRVIIGVDGGATRARAVVLSGEGRELARVHGAAGIIDPAAPGSAADVVIQLTRDALAASGEHAPAAALGCGLAGAGNDQAREAVRVALTLAGLADYVVVMSDAEAAMFDAFHDDTGHVTPGVLLVAGTGSIAWARTATGETIRAGGWGALLDDAGSAYALGIGALRCVMRAADSRISPTRLTDAVLARTRTGSPAALVPWTAAADKATIAALAPVVLEMATERDHAAETLVSQAVDDLTELAVHVAGRAGLGHPHFALTGGLIDPSAPLRRPLIDAITVTIPAATFLTRSVDAARGAALSTRRDSGIGAAWRRRP